MAEVDYISKITVSGKTYDVKDEVARAEIKPVNDGKLTIQQNGTSVGTFTANQSTDTTVNITVPEIPDLSKVVFGEDVTTVETNTPLNADTLEGHSASYFATATQITDLATVATTGSYGDLSNIPTYATVATTGSYNDLSNKPSYATVASTGSYTDLSNRPNDNQLRTIYIGTSDPTSSTGSNGDIYVKYSS